MKKNAIISWSSGKDAALVLERLIESTEYEVVGLFTTHVKDTVPFQATPIEVVQAQADSIGLPLISIGLEQAFPPNEQYQASIIKALRASGLPIDAVAFGDMFCNGIAEYRRSYIEPAGWECVLPLLEQPSSLLAEEIIARGIETEIITVDSQQLSPEYCGKNYDHNLLASLPSGVDPCGEDGEFHTLVTNAPSFRNKLRIERQSIVNDGRFYSLCYKYIA
ncbi:ATPase [Vibrio sp. WXL210]|uniref:Dph6-related ATP pyrophosphatase n=1 Tax=Vibrio sp. WXL210 TaxID=3450709 RepID=UPI003EC52AFF